MLINIPCIHTQNVFFYRNLFVDGQNQQFDESPASIFPFTQCKVLFVLEWNGWRRMSGVICDRRVPARVKGKVYKVAVRTAMLYGLETVALTRRQEAEMEVAELKMLRISLGVTRMDKIRNEYIRGTAQVGRIGEKT